MSPTSNGCIVDCRCLIVKQNESARVAEALAQWYICCLKRVATHPKTRVRLANWGSAPNALKTTPIPNRKKKKKKKRERSLLSRPTTIYFPFSFSTRKLKRKTFTQVFSFALNLFAEKKKMAALSSSVAMAKNPETHFLSGDFANHYHRRHCRNGQPSKLFLFFSLSFVLYTLLFLTL